MSRKELGANVYDVSDAKIRKRISLPWEMHFSGLPPVNRTRAYAASWSRCA